MREGERVGEIERDINVPNRAETVATHQRSIIHVRVWCAPPFVLIVNTLSRSSLAISR